MTRFAATAIALATVLSACGSTTDKAPGSSEPAPTTKAKPAPSVEAKADEPALLAGTEGARAGSTATEGGDETASHLPATDSYDPARAQALAFGIRSLLADQHLRRHSLDDKGSRDAFKLFLEGMDAAKTFLLQGDVHRLRVHESTMDDQLRSGDLVLAREAAKIMTARVAAVQAMLEEVVAKPFDLTAGVVHETDGDKRSWCKTEDELRRRWRDTLTLMAFYRIEDMEDTLEAAAKATDPEGKKAAAEVPKDLAGREAEARKKIAERYRLRLKRMAQQDVGDKIEAFFNAITRTYDPHSAFMPPARKENFDIRMSGSLEGIGAVLQADKQYVKVVRIVPGSASWRQGELEASDLIMAVAEHGEEPVDVADMRLRDVVHLIRGKKGTKVVLKVRKSDNRIVSVPITRDVVRLEATYARGAVLEHPKLAGRKIGYIDVPSFYGNTRGQSANVPNRSAAGDVKRLIDKMRGDVDAVVLDLRGNGGGLLSDARKMAGLFFSVGPVVQTRDTEDNVHVLADKDDAIAFDGEVIVMVDRFSASAAEIVSGALQDYGRAIVVGSPQTHGKGTVQALLNLDSTLGDGPETEQLKPLGVIKLTRQQFFRITGGSTQHRGIIPDVILPDAAAHVESGERFHDFSIPWSQVDALTYIPWPGGGWDKAKLQNTSTVRQEANPLFQKVAKRSAALKKRQDETTVILSYDAWKKAQAAAEAELKALSLDTSEEAPRQKARILQYAKVTYDAAEAGRKTDSEEAKDKKSPDEHWLERVTHDAWLEEALFVLGDMKGAK